MRRLTPGDVACWVFTTGRPPEDLAPGWPPHGSQELARCVRPSYRLDLMDAGQPCLLWLSGRRRPGVHAVGVLAAAPHEDDAGPVVPLRLSLLAEPVDRAALLADPRAREAEVLRMPAGSNASWLSRRQFGAVLSRLPEGVLGRWLP